MKEAVETFLIVVGGNALCIGLTWGDPSPGRYMITLCGIAFLIAAFRLR